MQQPLCRPQLGLDRQKIAIWPPFRRAAGRPRHQVLPHRRPASVAAGVLVHLSTFVAAGEHLQNHRACGFTPLSAAAEAFRSGNLTKGEQLTKEHDGSRSALRSGGGRLPRPQVGNLWGQQAQVGETGRVLSASYKHRTMVIGYGPAKKIYLAMHGRRFTGLAAFLCEGCWAQFRKLLAKRGTSRPKCYPPFCPRRRRVQAGIRCPRFHILGSTIPLQAPAGKAWPARANAAAGFNYVFIRSIL
jgi:hypothetical protein